MTHKFPEAKLEFLCEEIVDCPHSTPKWTDRGVVVIRNQNIRRGRLDLSTTSYTDEENYQKRSKRIKLRPDDLIITREAPMGEVCTVPEGLRCCLGQRMVALRADSKRIVPRYLLFALQGHKVQHQIGFNEGTGSTVSNMRIPVLKGLDIPVPDLSDQKAIAQILGTLDDKIELNRKMNQTLEEIAKAIFKSWFVDFDPVRAKAEGRPTGLLPEISDLFPDELVNAEIGEIPKGWDIVGLNEVSSNRSKSVKPEQMAQFSCYVGLEHLPRGHIFLSNWANPSDVASNKTVFEQGDILFGKLRPYFEKSVIAPNGGVCSTDIIAIEPNANAEVFVACLVSQKRFFEFTSQGSTGTRMPRTSWKHMCEFEFALPTDQLLKQFQSIMSPLVERAMIGISECKTLSEIRDTLLPKLISGELRIPDAEKFLEEAGI